MDFVEIARNNPDIVRPARTGQNWGEIPMKDEMKRRSLVTKKL
jgi:hypothetical protein